MNGFLQIALRSLLLNKVRSILTMLGVIIGVAAVIILTSIVGGLQKTIEREFKSFGSNNLFLFPGQPGRARGPGGSVVNKLQFSFGQNLEKLNGIVAVSAQVFNSGDGQFKNKESKGITIMGVEDNYLKITSLDIAQGRFISGSEQAGARLVVVIGNTVKNNLFGKQNPLGQTIKLKNKNFLVIGVLAKRGAIFGADQDNEVFIPLNTARQRFQIDRPNVFYISVVNTEKIPQVQKEIERVISQKIDKEDFSVISQEQGIEFISSILGVLATALGGIAAISLVVGGVGIMNIMFVSVTERTREIGLRKAVGADSNNILTQFLLEAVILSLLGGIIGVLLGMGVSLVAGKFIDTSINPVYVIISFVVSAMIGIIFGVAPAIKASRLDPIVALRYE